MDTSYLGGMLLSTAIFAPGILILGALAVAGIYSLLDKVYGRADGGVETATAGPLVAALKASVENAHGAEQNRKVG